MPFVDHTVCVIIKHLLLEGVQRLVEFQPGLTGGEGRYEDIGLGAFDRIVMDTGVDGLPDVVGAQLESADFEGNNNNNNNNTLTHPKYTRNKNL